MRGTARIILASSVVCCCASITGRVLFDYRRAATVRMILASRIVHAAPYNRHELFDYPRTPSTDANDSVRPRRATPVETRQESIGADWFCRITHTRPRTCIHIGGRSSLARLRVSSSSRNEARGRRARADYCLRYAFHRSLRSFLPRDDGKIRENAHRHHRRRCRRSSVD